MQTAIAEKVVSSLSEKIEGDILFEKIHFKPFTTLVLKNVVIIDKEPAHDPSDPAAPQVDTFFQARYIIANMSLKNLTGHEGLHLDKVSVKDAQMNMVIQDNPDEGGEQVDNLTRIFGLVKKENVQYSEKEIFHIRKVDIEDFTFRLKNYTSNKTPYGGGINWNDLDISKIHIDVREMQFKGGIMSGEVEDMSFIEKSGYKCNSISGKARVGNGKTIVNDLKLLDPWSDIELPLYMMSYSSSVAFQNYIEEVRMDAEIARSVIDFKTLGYFAPELQKNSLIIDTDGGIFSGTVDDFSVRNMKVSSRAGGFAGTITGNMKGIPDIEKTTINAKVQKFAVSSKGLGLFISEWMEDGELDLSRFAEETIFHINAHAHGLLNNLNVKADISSSLGNVIGDIRLDDIIKEDRQIGISGSITTQDLDIGRFIGTDIIGETTLKASADVKLPDGKHALSASIDSLDIDRLHIHGYDYSQISGSGSLAEDDFDGRIACNDPNLNFIFHGRLGLSPRTNNTLYRFYAIVGHANLNAMNLDKRGKSEISFRTSADFTRTKGGDIYGDISLGDLFLENRDGRYDIGEIKLTSLSRNDIYRMGIKSGFINGTFTGTAPVTEFISDLNDITLKKELPSLFSEPGYEWKGNRYSLDVEFSKMHDVLSFAMPGLYIADNTSLSAKITDKGKLSGSLSSQRIAFSTNYMKDIELNFNNLNNQFNGELRSNEISIATLKLCENSFRMLADDDHIGLGYVYDNKSELENRGEFILHGNLSRIQDKPRLGINILPSMVYLNSREWRIQPSQFEIDKDGVQVSSIEFLSDDQSINIHGNLSNTRKDTLSLNLNRFDISILNPLLGGNQFGIKGAMTGSVQLTSAPKSKGLLADLICDSTYLAGKPLGVLSIGSNWDDDFERFDLTVKNEIAGQSNLNILGKLTPKTKSLEAIAHLDRLQIDYAKPFMEEIFSDMSGYISGSINLDGPLNSLDISSENTVLEEGMLRIAYTNVPYYADGAFHIDRSGVYFDDIAIKDRYTGTGAISGSINWDIFKNIRFNTKIKVNEIEGINLTEHQNETFYGSLFATGNITLTGPVSNLSMNIDAMTAKPGELHIPIATTATSGSTNLLKFTEIEQDVFIDPYEIMISRMQSKDAEASNFVVNLHVNAQPDVTAFVEIDKASGHVLSGRGNGTLDLTASEETFSINGDYTLTGGNYKFVALGFVNRDFEIQDGSSVTFNGDIFDSSLDIDALYRTKVSLSTLISDTTSVANRRTVECGIKITDKLINPRLSFSIEIPELDPTIKSRVESALSTEDKVQKQFLSVLLSNSFLPDEQSGIFNNSTMLYSNVAEVMSSQLNNILQKLNIPVDLGLNYQPNEKGNDVFDVAVSTQMFNNRVVVNGSVGNKQYSSGGQTDVVGDLDIEIKLDRSGAFRLNLFSHSADSYTNYLDNSQRNGVGLTYQTEFNSLRQFFKNIFSNKKKRQEARRAEEEAMIDGERVNINITD